MLLLEILMTILFMLFLPFYFVERVLHKKSHGWKEKFGGVLNGWSGNIRACSDPLSDKPKVIMLHGCSVGEALALENLLKAIRANFPDYKIVVTTSTCAGQEIAQKKYGKIADYVTYFPFDNPIPVNRFLDRINPSAVLIVETEIWPYFAYSCKKRGIPLSIINARISDLSYPSYKRMKWFFSKVLKNYTSVYAQSNEDKEKFISIGMPSDKVEMMGNLKFDIGVNKEDDFVTGDSKSKNLIDIGQEGYRVFLAGSTHKPENEIVISTYKQLKEKHTDLKMIIAPRHLERVGDIRELLGKYNLSYALRSKNEKFSNETDVLILDTLGELKNMYSACDLAFVGGSFNKTGGHNPLEATIFEKPVVSGPAVFNFKDIYDILCKSQAGKVVKTQAEMFEYLNALLSDKDFYVQTKSACKKVFETQRGAIDFVINKLKTI